MKPALAFTETGVWSVVLRLLILTAVAAASLPAAVVSTRFFLLVRCTIRIGLLPEYPATIPMHDSCAGSDDLGYCARYT